MNDTTLFFTKMFRVSNHAVIKACANRQNHIGIVHRVVGFESSMHPQHANKLLVGSGIASQAHQGICDREIQFPGQQGQFFCRIRQDSPATGINNRAFGFLQNLYSPLDLAKMAFDNRVV